MCKLAILFTKSINFKQLYELETPNVCTAVRCETVVNKQTFTLTNKWFFDFIPNTVVGQCGNSLPEIVGVPAEQRSSLWCKSAYSEAPGAFSAGGGRRNNQSSPSALFLLLLSFKRLLWLQDDLLSFSFLSQLVFWQRDTLQNQTVTLAAPGVLQMHFCDSKVAPDSDFAEWACMSVQTYPGSQLLWDHIPESVVY